MTLKLQADKNNYWNTLLFHDM